MLLISLFLILSPLTSLAFSWRRRSGTVQKAELGTKEEPQQILSIDGLLDEEDYKSLRLNLDALQVYSRKPDCFKRAAATIRSKCTDIDMDEEGRVTAAISMTLCEVATAKHHSLPLECLPYSLDHAHILTNRHMSLQTQGECVDSLSRSAQFWSSYSGYLREVPQLCYAFRRWHDIDLARDIYHNATVEKLALVRFLVSREKKSEQVVEEMLKQSSNMRNLGLEIHSLSEDYRSNINAFIVQLREEIHGLLSGFKRANLELFAQAEKVNSGSVALVQTGLVGALQRHSSDLEALLLLFGPALEARFDNMFAQHEAQYQRLDILVSDAYIRWSDLGQSLTEMKQDVLQLSGYTAQTSTVLEVTLNDAQSIRKIQSEASLAASELLTTVGRLTHTTQAGLEAINGSAHLIKQRLELQIEEANLPWKNWLIKIIELVYWGDV